MIKYKFWSNTKNTLSDIKSVNSLLKQLNPDAKETSLKKMNQYSKHSKILLALDQNNKIIGMATLALVYIPIGVCGRIEDVVVDSNFRGQGIGTTLIQKIISKAKKLHLNKLDLTSKPDRIEANKLYTNLKFFRYETNVYRMKFE